MSTERFGVDELNLNSEYRDTSKIRNIIMLNLFKSFDFIVPETKLVNLVINGKYQGVYIDVENLENRAFKKRDITTPLLFKIADHLGYFAPAAHFSDLQNKFEKKTYKDNENLSHEDVYMLILNCYYLDDDEFIQYFQDNFLVDNVLLYFALEYYAIVKDNFTSNYYLYKDLDKNKWGFIPWDNDGSLGALWDGKYEYIEGSKYSPTFNINVLITRLLDNEEYRVRFLQNLNVVAKRGNELAGHLADSLYNEYKLDIVHDPARVNDTASISRAIEHIKYFVKERNKFVENLDDDDFQRERIDSFSISTPFIDKGDIFLVRAHIKDSQLDRIKYQYVAGFDTCFDYSDGEQIGNYLYDDGETYDIEKDDDIFGNKIEFSEVNDSRLPFSFYFNDHHFPINSYENFFFLPTHMYMLVNDYGIKDKLKNLHIDKIYSYQDDIFH